MTLRSRDLWLSVGELRRRLRTGDPHAVEILTALVWKDVILPDLALWRGTYWRAGCEGVLQFWPDGAGYDPFTETFDVDAWEAQSRLLKFPLTVAGWRRAWRAARCIVHDQGGSQLLLEIWQSPPTQDRGEAA